MLEDLCLEVLRHFHCLLAFKLTDGLITPGGLSLYSTRRGFACDSITSFEVVLASGAIIHADATRNSNLWVALKGGLNNFGIVTSFTMRTFRSGKIWGGIAYYMPNSFSALAEATVDFVLNEKDEDTHVIASAGYGFGHEVVTCCMYQTQGVENSASLQRFINLPGVIEAHGTLRTASHIEFCNELSSFTKDGVRYVAAIRMRSGELINGIGLSTQPSPSNRMSRSFIASIKRGQKSSPASRTQKASSSHSASSRSRKHYSRTRRPRVETRKLSIPTTGPS